MASNDGKNTPIESNTSNGEATNKPNYFVGIGASAGGLEAIQSFFKNVQAGAGVTYIVVQHLSPDYKSLMVELLAKVTDLEVQRAEDGVEVKADHIYLIPPKKNLKIFHGALLLSEQERLTQTVNLPIDIFFTSLAEDAGSKAIAVVLSGAGSDGTRGCRAIKEAGGMVMVQDEHTAKFDAMPHSVISSSLPDFVLSPDEMPRQLMGFINHPYTVRDRDEHTILEDKTGITRIFSLLRERAKIDFTFYKPSTIVRRIERRMTVKQIDQLEDYVAYLEKFPREQNTLYRELLIGVTSFFRDPEVFEQLQEEWLVNSLKEHVGNDYRIWVAGCSTGEEAYSYAILCREILDQHGLAKNVKIFATDVDQDAISNASIGIYPESITADIPPQLLSKYFIRQGDHYRIIRQIREMVVFARHNLIKDPPFTNIELVSCRNLLIYLQPVLQTRVLESLNFSLRSGGLLVLGSSESLGEAESYFETIDNRRKLFRALGHRKPLTHTDRFTSRGLYQGRDAPQYHAPTGAQAAYEEERVLGRFVQSVGGDVIPFAMIVDEESNLVYVIGEGHSYLNPPSGKVDSSISSLVVKDLAIPLSTGLAKVFKSNIDVSFTNVRITSAETSVDVRIKPLRDQRGKNRLAAVLIEETGHLVTEESGDDVNKGTTYDLSLEAEQRIKDLEQELQFTRENLQASIEELETSNEELQATNEELLASNEELQSTNEELQSVNEELFTVNAEHQNKITELLETNNDLDNYVNSTDVVSVFLDENLDIRRFTENASDVFNIMQQDVGRPFEHISNRMNDIDIHAMIDRVNSGGNVEKQQVFVPTYGWFLLRVRPYLVSENQQSGVVVVLSNIDEIKALQSNLSDTRIRYEEAQRAAGIGTWEWNIKDGTLVWSDTVERMFGLPPGGFHGTFDEFKDRVHPDDLVTVDKAIRESIASASTYSVEHRVIWPDKHTEIWVAETAKVEYDDAGNAIKMLGVVREITERKNAQNELRFSHQVLDTLTSTAPSGIVVLKGEQIEWANDRFEEITGYSRNELMESGLGILFDSPEGLRKDLDERIKQISENKSYSSRASWRRKDGSTTDVLVFGRKSQDDPAKGLILTVVEVDLVPELSRNCPIGTDECPLSHCDD